LEEALRKGGIMSTRLGVLEMEMDVLDTRKRVGGEHDTQIDLNFIHC
jgi:hypothetical protein